MVHVTSNDQLTGLAIKGPRLDRDLQRRNAVVEVKLEQLFAFLALSKNFNQAKRLAGLFPVV